jgi:DNA-binding TFAR19-related protein (PDSD5 family)
MRWSYPGLTSEDQEVELWRQRRMLELKRKLLLKQSEKGAEPQEKPSPKASLDKVFVGRAWEVWNAAESQYPEVIKRLKKALVELVEKGDLKGSVDGEQLYSFLQRLGLNIRLETKIRYIEGGQLKTIEEKLRGD